MADDIVAYLEAQFAKDTRADFLPHSSECNAFGDGDYGYEFRGDLCDCGWPARVLAEVQAKRRILELHEPTGSDLFDDGIRWCATCPRDDGWPCGTVLALAQPFAGEPGFDPSWLMET